MAGKVITGPLYCFVLHNSRNLCLLNLPTNLRRYGKKQYDYDLDSLIEWNKDTALAFGSPMKLTKTGKIRKTKKAPDEQLAQTLEEVNALSTSVPGINGSFKFLKINSFTQPKMRSEKEQTDLSNEDIPENSFEDKIPEYNSTVNTVHSQFFPNSLPQGTLHREMTEDGIFIPQIKPVPQHTANKKVKQNYEEPSLPPNNALNEPAPEGKFNSTISSGIKLYKTKSKDMATKEAVDEFKQFHLEKDDSSLSTTSQTSQLDLSLPVEAPESFKLITEFPLALDQTRLQYFTTNEKLQAYKKDIENLGLRTLPSVKSILSRTMPDLNRFFLSRWREGMIKELGEEGFKLHQDATIKRGINLHANIMELLSGKPLSEIQIMPDNEGHWTSIQSAISVIGDVQALEAEVKHPYLIYRGVFDCIARYKDLLCVVDWKTSKKPRPLLKNTYDDPLQIAAYVGAVNSTNTNENKLHEINHGVIVVAYPDGSPAHIHMMNRTQCEHYWHDWTERLYNYYQLIYTGKYGQK